MIIRRLDVFFRTQLTLDTPNFFNSVTNLFFAPLQHLIGQHKYQSLQGRASPLPQTSSVDYGTTIRRVISIFALILAAGVITTSHIPLWIIGSCAVMMALGTATRYMSFRSAEVSEAYSIAFLSQMAIEDRTDLLKQLPLEVQAKFLSLDVHQDYSIAYLLQNVPEYDKPKLLLTPTLIQALGMAKKPSTDPKDLPSPPISPRSPPASPSLPVPGVAEPESMDDIQRQPQLAAARAEETSSSTTPAAVPRTSPVTAAQPSSEQFRKLEELLLVVTILQFGSPYHSKMFSCDKNVEAIGKKINLTIGMINRLFEALLKAPDPNAWLEKGKQNPSLSQPLSFCHELFLYDAA